MGRSSSAFGGKWIAGILATVISAVAIYYLTRPVPPKPAPIAIEGRVIDIAAKTLIPGALVTLQAGSFSGQQATDSLGRYGFDVPLPKATEATFTIAANGYPPYSLNATIEQLSAAEDNELLREAAGGGAESAAATPGEASGQPAGGAATPAGAPADARGRGPGALAAVAAHTAIAAAAGQATQPSQSPSAAEHMVSLPPYVRRPDFVVVDRKP